MKFLGGSCAELIEMGLSPVDRYVVVDGEQRDTRVKAHQQLVGRVKILMEASWNSKIIERVRDAKC